MAGVERISLLERSKERLLFLLLFFIWESNVCTKSREVGIEGATLTDSVGPRLLTMQDQTVLLGVLIAALVLFALPWIFRVAHLVQVRERLCLDASAKSRSTLGYRALGRSKRDVLKFRLANLLVRAGRPGRLLLRSGAQAAKTSVIFAWILVRVTKRVALELSKSFLGVLATVDGHATVQANFVALLAISLVASAGVTHSKSDRH